MASTLRASKGRGVVHVQEMWIMGLLLTLCVLRSGADNNAAHVRDDFCPEIQYVYPYWSVCDEPLQYFEAVHLVSGDRGGLETGTSPWNEVVFTNSSELLGATYYALPLLGSEAVSGVPVNKSVFLFNNETNLPLVWRFHPFFRTVILAQATSKSEAGAALFRFLTADTPVLPCPRIAHARCESYTLLSDPTAPQGTVLDHFSDAWPTVLVPLFLESQEPLTFQVIRPSVLRAFI